MRLLGAPGAQVGGGTWAEGCGLRAAWVWGQGPGCVGTGWSSCTRSSGPRAARAGRALLSEAPWCRALPDRGGEGLQRAGPSASGWAGRLGTRTVPRPQTHLALLSSDPPATLRLGSRPPHPVCPQGSAWGACVPKRRARQPHGSGPRQAWGRRGTRLAQDLRLVYPRAQGQGLTTAQEEAPARCCQGYKGTRGALPSGTCSA